MIECVLYAPTTSYDTNIIPALVTVSMNDISDSSPDNGMSTSAGFILGTSSYRTIVSFNMSGYSDYRLYFDNSYYSNTNAITTNTSTTLYVGNVWVLNE